MLQQHQASPRIGTVCWQENETHHKSSLRNTLVRVADLAITFIRKQSYTERHGLHHPPPPKCPGVQTKLASYLLWAIRCSASCVSVPHMRSMVCGIKSPEKRSSEKNPGKKSLWKKVPKNKVSGKMVPEKEWPVNSPKEDEQFFKFLSVDLTRPPHEDFLSGNFSCKRPFFRDFLSEDLVRDSLSIFLPYRSPQSSHVRHTFPSASSCTWHIYSPVRLYLHALSERRILQN